MEFVTQRQYRGPLKAAIFDWAGTTIDYGCCAPAGTFQDLFRRNGVKAAMELQIFPWESIVKIGDTVTDVLEGLNAGMWTIALTRQGNEVGLSRAEAETMAPEELVPRIERAAQKLAQAGAHYVAESVEDIPPLLDAIEARLARGERP